MSACGRTGRRGGVPCCLLNFVHMMMHIVFDVCWGFEGAFKLIVDCKKSRKVNQLVCFVLRVGARGVGMYLVVSVIKTGE